MKIILLLSVFLVCSISFGQIERNRFSASVSFGFANRPNDNLNASDQYLSNNIYTISLFGARYFGKKKVQSVGISLLDRNIALIDSSSVLAVVNNNHFDTLAELTSGNFSYTNLSLAYSISYGIKRWKLSNILSFGPSLVVKDDIEIVYPNSNIVFSKGGYFFGYHFRNTIRNEFALIRNEAGSFGFFADYGISYGNTRLDLENRSGNTNSLTIKKSIVRYKIFEQIIKFGIYIAW